MNKIYQTNVQIDTPTPLNGKIYTREILEGAIREYLDSDMQMGQLSESGDDGFELTPERISHNVKNAYIDENGILCIEVAFLDTEQGKLAALMPDLLNASCAMMAFCGWEGDSKVVEECAIININLEWANEEALAA